MGEQVVCLECAKSAFRQTLPEHERGDGDAQAGDGNEGEDDGRRGFQVFRRLRTGGWTASVSLSLQGHPGSGQEVA